MRPRGVADAIPNAVWYRLGYFFAFMGGIAWLLAKHADPSDWWLHGTWCFIGLVAALPVMWNVFRKGFVVVLVEHRLTFLVAFGLYFLFGAALLSAGPDIQAAAVLRYYPIDAKDALRVNAINGLGFGLALIAATMFRGKWLGERAARAAAAVAKIPDFIVIALFLILGAATSAYVFRLDLSVHQGLVPGILRSAGRFSLVAIFLAAAHRGRGEWWLRLVGTILAFMLGIGGAIQFSKTDALLPVAALVGGWALRFGSHKVLPVGLLLLVSGYLVLGDLASYGRSAIGFGGVASVAERWQILEDGWHDTRDLVEEDQYGTWGRLCYTPSQAAALDFRDIGEGGDGFRLLPWVFVPRLLAEDKPEITKTGREFNAKIVGYESSSTGQGVFASGYYHGGWLGFLIASAICGWVLAQTSAIARAIVARRALLLLPFCLLGLYIAFRIDGDFVADYVGAFVFTLYPVLAVSALAAVMKLPRGRLPLQPR